jgi:hypothetical protein
MRNSSSVAPHLSDFDLATAPSVAPARQIVPVRTAARRQDLSARRII